MIFAAPAYGWCRICIGDWTMPGSYLADYPHTIPEALIKAYDAYDAAEIGDVLSSFSIDGEDAGVFTVKIGCGAVEVWEYEGDIDAGDHLVYSFSCDKDALAEMLLEAAEDLMQWFDEWTVFWSMPEEDETGRFTPEGLEEIRDRASDFTETATELVARAMERPTRRALI